MIRQLLIAALFGLALSACGVGADEDLNQLGISDQALEQASSPDPVPPKVLPGAVVGSQAAQAAMNTVGSGMGNPGNPGDQNASTPDPIPPKGASIAYLNPSNPGGPITHIRR